MNNTNKHTAHMLTTLKQKFKIIQLFFL